MLNINVQERSRRSRGWRGLNNTHLSVPLIRDARNLNFLPTHVADCVMCYFSGGSASAPLLGLATTPQDGGYFNYPQIRSGSTVFIKY